MAEFLIASPIVLMRVRLSAAAYICCIRVHIERTGDDTNPLKKTERWIVKKPLFNKVSVGAYTRGKVNLPNAGVDLDFMWV